MASEILSEKQHLAGILNPNSPIGQGTILEYVVLQVLGDCTKEKMNYKYDLTSSKYGSINVKSASRTQIQNGYGWVFGKRPNSYIPNYYVCVGLNGAYNKILHVWKIPGNSEIVNLRGIHVIDNQQGLIRTEKYEVDPEPYDKAFNDLDFTSFPEFRKLNREEVDLAHKPAWYGVIPKQYFNPDTGVVSSNVDENCLELEDGDCYPLFEYNNKYRGYIENGNFVDIYEKLHQEFLQSIALMESSVNEEDTGKLKQVRETFYKLSKTYKRIYMSQVKEASGIENPEYEIEVLRKKGIIIQIESNEFMWV